MLEKILKKTGIIGFVTGIIGFIITLIYVCFNGYIFNNDVAYVEWDMDNNKYIGLIKKLYPNGAEFRCDDSKNPNCYIPVYENDKNDFREYAKYKDLGGKQYNYDTKYYKAFQSSSSCQTSGTPANKPGCGYSFPNNPPTEVYNKDLYHRWTTTLILNAFIVACNIGLLIFGFLIFKSGGESNEPKTVEIQ